jgi:branched-chain amino acid transport system permease protein
MKLTMSRPWAAGLGVVAIAALLPLLLPSHEIHVLIQVLMFAYLAYCWNVLGGFAGQLSFGHPLFMAVGAYTSTLMLLKLGISPWIGMVVGALLAAMLGIFIGFLSFRYGVKGTYFSLVTLAFMEIARIVALNTEAIGGAMGLYIPIKHTDFLRFEFAEKAHYYYVMLAFVLLALAITGWLQHSVRGRRLVAIRENEDAAQALGINLLSHKLFATALSAALTAMGGTLYAQYITFIDPDTLLNMSLGIEITIYAIVGGVGTLLGPLVGAALLVPIAELVRASLGQSHAGVHLIVYGAVLMAVILFAPEGLLGLLRTRLLPWLRAGRRPSVQAVEENLS